MDEKNTQPNKAESTDQMYVSLQLVPYSGWLFWGAFAVVCLVIVIWAVFGTLSHRGDGMGIVLWKNSRIYQASASSAGTVANIQTKPGSTVTQGEDIITLRHLVDHQKIKIAEKQRDFAKQEYTTWKSLTTEESAKRETLLARRIKTLESNNTELKTQLAYLKNLERNLEKEVKAGYATAQMLHSTRADIDTVQQTIADNSNTLVSLDEKQLAYLSQNALKAQQLLNSITEAQEKLSELTTQVNIATRVRAPVDGIVTSVNSDLGEFVDAGAKLVTIEAQGKGLEVFAYLPPDKGKRVRPGMRALVTPTTVKRDIYGSIIARVDDVSRLPVSRKEVLAVVGENDLAQSLTADSAPIQVKLVLTTDSDTYSGLAWTSSNGPRQKISPGEFAYVSVELDKIHPINLLIPVFHEWIAPDTSASGQPDTAGRN
ncbi:p-hydroxybenzoic acid efflux pump subunit AaeA [BD1-7 clade bacterium]|uniref:p-hydroxybenzoic acid efflux pump subunit AaeA n=1 Tax=BD1-7 clade bacterium TaxID=2029982 RepID=A0A5S9QYC2_9GAMM|nr:p-hydroxybenzoic acid efflux pump subunit AaeA [BD1-7 clade bacterium]